MKICTHLIRLSFLWAFFFLAGNLPAQSQTKVNGVVTDEAGMEIIGASVQEKGTTNGTITDLSGAFNLTTGSNAVLVISYIGYVTQEATPGPGMRIVLKEDAKRLEEVVVVGYGVQKKSVVTGAISSVKAEEMMTSANTRPEQALQGKTSGVQVISSSGAPGSEIKIRVRGYSSNGNADPLYIVDGLRTADISTLEPANIASMEVLKDGASAAIYGAEGGNGVILITTKNGKAGRTQINYDFQYTIQSLGKKARLMRAEEYLEYMQEAGMIGTSTQWDGTDTDWINETFESSPMQKHNLSISGGSDVFTYLGSLSYLEQEGIVTGKQDGYKRYSGMFNGSVQANKWLKMTSSIQINRATKRAFNENDESRGVLSNAMMMDPLTPVTYTGNSNLPSHVQKLVDAGQNLMQDDNGNYYGISQYVTGECVNPFVQRNLAQVKTTNSSLMTNIGFDVTPFDGFKFTSKVGLHFNQYNAHTYKPEFYYSSEMNNPSASVAESDATTLYWQWENYASYTQSIDKHNFSAILGTALSSKEYKTVTASGYPLLKDQPSYAELDYLSSQAGSNVGGTTIVDRKASYFGRVNYNYDEKYLLEATVRRDAAGLSILPRDKRWGTFPAVALGWVVSQEAWFPKNTPVDFLKIRASWGQNGSLSNLGNYSYAAAIASSGTTMSFLTWGDINSSYLYPLADGSYATAAYPSSLGNYSLTWETSEQIDLGFDIRMFNSRLTFGFDYYHKKTKDLITTNTPALEAGNTASPINGGDVLNKGFDIELAWRDKIGQVSYGVSGNFSALKNKVTYLDPSIERITGYRVMNWSGATAFEKGYPIWYFRGYRTDGLKADGDINIVDMNEDGTINSGDFTMIGSPIPDFTYGLTLNLGYKGFDFCLFLNGSQGNDVLYVSRRPDRPLTNRLRTFANDRWTAGNPNATYPSAAFQINNTDFWNSDKMVFDGSYMKIKQIQIGYNLPKAWLSKATITGLRLYVSLDDFFTFTKYPGMDPEATSSDNTSPGVDRGFFPNAKKLMFGLSLSL